MNNIRGKRKIINIILLSVYLILDLIILYLYYKTPNYTSDFEGNRTICGYVLYGLNPYKLVGKEPVIPSLGMVYSEFGNLPFGLLLGNLFYFGFLKLNMSLLCYKILTVILLILLNYFAYKYFKNNFENYFKELFLGFFVVSFTVFSLFASYRVHNAGHMICMLIIMAIFTADNHKLLSGIFLAFAMVKPQITVPFCVLFFLYKKYMPFFTAVIIDVLASIVCALLVKENVITLYIDFLKQRVGGGMTSYGLLSIFFKEDVYRALFPSMIFGIILLFIAYIMIKNKSENNLILFSFAAIIANIWSYAWSSDFYILLLPTFAYIYAFLFLFDRKDINILIKSYFLLSSFICIFLLIIKYAMKNVAILREIIVKVMHCENYNIATFSVCYIILIVIMFSSIHFFNKYDIK